MMAVKALRSNPNWVIFEKVDQMHIVQMVHRYRRAAFGPRRKNCIVETQPDDSTTKRPRQNNLEFCSNAHANPILGDESLKFIAWRCRRAGFGCQAWNPMMPELML